MFNENSGLVQVWVRQILSGEKTIDDVPDISNLREVVISVLSNYKEEQKKEKING